MKKVMLIGLLFVANIAGAACMGPFCWDDSGAYINGNLNNGNGNSLPSKTIAQINATTPNAAGQRVYCSNCTQSHVCVSSGTTNGAYVIEVETGTFVAGTETHCR